jgi:lysozyme family protein
VEDKMKQFTEEEAIAIYNSNVWKDLDNEEIVKLQLFQNRLCMDFGRFHEAMEKVLDRPIWTHEFAKGNCDSLIKEYLGEKDKPSFEDIINLIPEEKRIIIGV